MGHIARNCPLQKDQFKKNRRKRYHAHAAKEEDEPVWISTREERESSEEYSIIFALTGSITHGCNTWLVDNSASKHTTGFQDSFSNLVQKDSPHKVNLGDDYQYPIKGVGEASYKLDSGKSLKMNEVLFVSDLKNNLLSISALDKKGYQVAFMDGEVLM